MFAYTLFLPIWIPAWWVRLGTTGAAGTPIAAIRPLSEPDSTSGLSVTTSAVSRQKDGASPCSPP